MRWGASWSFWIKFRNGAREISGGGCSDPGEWWEGPTLRQCQWRQRGGDGQRKNSGVKWIGLYAWGGWHWLGWLGQHFCSWENISSHFWIEKPSLVGSYVTIKCKDNLSGIRRPSRMWNHTLLCPYGGGRAPPVSHRGRLSFRWLILWVCATGLC